MGNEVSKESQVEPPAEWDPSSNAKKFELVSPMSDLSDPSMFLHRRPHPKLSDATVQQIAGKKQTKAGLEPPAKLHGGPERRGPTAARQTTATDRRRRSKVIATRDSAYKHESRPREMPPPSAFYFPDVPTRESEEKINRLSSSTGARRQSNTTMNKSDNHENDLKQDNKENVAHKNTPLLRKARRKVNRAKTCLTGCFEDSGNNLQLMKDNANPNVKRGQRLSSEVGTKARESLETAKENPVPEAPAFDPYQEDPLPKAQPTVLQFIDGTEQELTFNPVWRESHDGTYHSDPSSTGNARRSSDFAMEKRSSKESSRRASDPPSRDCRLKPAKKETKKKEEKKIKNEQVPHPPGDRFDQSKEGENRESFELNKTSEKRESVESTQTSREHNSRESTSSAPSHESSYWNGFYKEAQVLHHEDAYFDRIAFDPTKSSAPEPSPMATNSTATPVAALFVGQEKPKSLLGSLDAGDVDYEELFGPDDTAEDQNRRATGSRIEEDAPSTRGSLKSALSTQSSSDSEYEQASRVNQKGDIQPPGVKFGQTATESTCLDEKAPVDDHQGMTDEKTQSVRGGSFLDRRITADQILVQTSLVTKIPERNSLNPVKLAIKEALQATPQNSAIVNRPSFGSAYSYRDKDVFTPVTSSTTYPNGSPFRPRLAIAEKTIAKADLDRPVVFTQSLDIRSRSSGEMEIHASESAPSMIESHDYRDIALGCFPDDEGTLASTKHERALALYSPGIMDIDSPMSSIKSPGHPLLSTQVVDNAAFLFSPSYANEQALVSVPSKDGMTVASQRSSRRAGQIELKARERTYSISTLGSRSRLSGRSKKSIRIPCSSSASLLSIQSKAEKTRVSEDGSRQQKSVRFSDGGESVAESLAASQKSRRSVTWDFSFKEAPDNVDIPAIETKVSDLSDTVFGGDNSTQTNSKRESTDSYSDSVKSTLREDIIEEETASMTLSETVSQASFAPSLQSRVTSVPSDEREDTSKRESMSSATSHQSFRSSISTAKTPEQATRTWTYNEFTKGVTPLLDRKQLAQATNSPVLRFKAAKNKFVVKPEKEVPVKKSTPPTFKRKTGTGRVHLLASQFDNGRAPGLMALKSTARDFGTANHVKSAGPSSLVPEERRMLRTPQIIGYTAKTHPDIYTRASVGSHSTTHTMTSKSASAAAFGLAPQRTMSVDESVVSRTMSETPFDEIPEEVSDDDDSSQQSAGSDDSTLVQSVATLRQDRNSSANVNVIESYQDQDALDAVLNEILEQSDSREQQDDSPEDEIEADDFAELLLNNILGVSSHDESSVSASSSNFQPKKGGKSILYAYDDEENSTFTNIQAAPTFSDESTTMSAMLAQQITANLRHGAETVKPHVQKLHSSQALPTTQALNLSPLQRTPMQASKWRELAEQAQKQDNQKKSIFRGKSAKKKKSGLSERNTNII